MAGRIEDSCGRSTQCLYHSFLSSAIPPLQPPPSISFCYFPHVLPTPTHTQHTHAHALDRRTTLIHSHSHSRDEGGRKISIARSKPLSVAPDPSLRARNFSSALSLPPSAPPLSAPAGGEYEFPFAARSLGRWRADEPVGSNRRSFCGGRFDGGCRGGGRAWGGGAGAAEVRGSSSSG